MSGVVTVVNGNGGCPGCGQGRGKRHYERCRITVPAYDRPLTQQEVKGLTAYAIAVFPIDVVRRSTIRAMLPRGRRRPRPSSLSRRLRGADNKVNVVSDHFQRALKWLADKGWIERREDCVIVQARDPLHRYAQRALADSPELAHGLRASLAAVAAGLAEESLPAIRRQRDAELRALQRLMEESPATGPHQGRGYVRLAHKPGLLP